MIAGTLERVRERYRAVNGEAPMTTEDDAYVRSRFVTVPDPDSTLPRMADGDLPLPAYLLSDGTPMVPADHLDPVGWAGGVAHLHDWFTSHWDHREQEDAEREWTAYLSGRYAACLTSVTPGTIRDRARLTEQVESATARLAQSPGDPVARGSLGEAVAALEALLAPMTGYDRLRLGGPGDLGGLGERTPREVWVEDVRRDHLSPVPPPLPIRTERLLLRRLTPDDAVDLHAYYGDAQVALHLLHPAYSLRETEAEIRRRRAGTGTLEALNLGIELDGRIVGDVVLMLAPPSYVQAEIGWVVNPAVGGRGIATEAATALLEVAFGHYRVLRVHAELDARNLRSAALSERLGMRQEGSRRCDYWSRGEWTDSREYAVLAEEWAALRAD